MIDTQVSGDLPAKDQEDRESEQNRVGARRASHHEAEVHHRAEEGRDANQGADDQTDTNQNFTDCDQLGEPGVPLMVQHVGQELAIPAVGDSR